MYNKYLIIFMISLFICLSGCEQQAKNELEESTQNLQDKALNKNLNPDDSVMIVEIVAMTGENENVSIFNQVIKLNPSSKDINLKDLGLTVHDEKFLYTYSKESCDNIPGLKFGHKFGVEYKIKGDNWKEGYISNGDVVNLCYEFSSNIRNYEEMIIGVRTESVTGKLTSLTEKTLKIPSCPYERCYLFP